MSVVRELTPTGLGVVAAGVVIYVALDRGWGVGPWLLGLLLVGHGLVHAVFLLPAPDPVERAPGASPYPFRMADSWLIGRAGADVALVRLVGTVLIALTVAAFVLAALASVGWLVPADWWGALVIGAAVLSSLVLVLFLAPLLLLGFLINAALIWLALGSLWSPGAGSGT